MHPQERGEVIKLYNRASPHWIIVFINGAVAVRHRCDIAQGMVLLDLQLEKLADGLPGAARVIPRHEWILAPDYRVFDLS
jgi:hypothetical protein